MKVRDKDNRDHQKDEVAPILSVTPIDYDSLFQGEAYPGGYAKGLWDLWTMEQMKWVMILIISHNIKTKEYPENLSRAVLIMSRRKSFFIWQRVAWYSLTACGESHPQEKGLENKWLSEHWIGDDSVWPPVCNSYLQSPKVADSCELRSIANSRPLCSHPSAVTLFLSICHRSWLETAWEISGLTQTTAFKTQNACSFEHYFAVKWMKTKEKTQQPLWKADASF